MRVSVCPTCYKKGEVKEGKFINNANVNGQYYAVYWCKDCKDSYKEQ